jgi:hypothetical protein
MMADNVIGRDPESSADQSGRLIAAALDRQTAALLTVASTIVKASASVTGPATPAWIKESVLQLFNELLGTPHA